jgi:CheY-like chemotaxis protein
MIADNPMADANRTTVAAVTTTPRRFRILVVDDNHDSALSLAMMLSIMGHETRTAHDGESAVETAESFLPDVVLLDIGLPKLNGYEVAQRIREQAWGASMFLIAVTGWGQEEDRQRSSEVGLNVHMVKPVEPAALEKLLADLPPNPTLQEQH